MANYQQPMMATMPGQGRQFVGSSQRAPPNSQQTPEQFVARWGLDEGSLTLLHGLDPSVQAAVINEFQPRGDTKDISGKFCAFARSVSSRFASGGPKRGGNTSLGQG